jgi:rod shape determining protein RodA
MNQQSPNISRGVDWSMVWMYLILCVIGIMCIFAATYREGDNVMQSFLSLKTDYSKQALYFLLAIALGIVILLTDSKFFTATANLFYLFGILLMFLVFPFHSRIKGTESIIKLGLFNIQPAELCKIFVNLALAKYLSQQDTDFSKLKSQLIATGLVLFPAILCRFQSETGLALVYFSFFLVMYREGLPGAVLVIGFSLAALVVATLLLEPDTLAIILTVIAVITIYVLRKQIKKKRRIFFMIAGFWILCVGVQRFAVPFFFDHVLEPYQVKRIYDAIGRDYVPKNQAQAELVLKEEESKSRKSQEAGNYNVRQSKIAIGSGGLFGKGLLKGTQTRYGFVPEQRTDFIFDTIGEGFGFVGSFIFLSLYLVLLLRIVTVAERQRSTFSRAYAYGVAAVIFFHTTINVGMTIGLVPVIGIPLPFVSYGGTSFLTFSVMLFILVRLDADRHMVLR